MPKTSLKPSTGYRPTTKPFGVKKSYEEKRKAGKKKREKQLEAKAARVAEAQRKESEKYKKYIRNVIDKLGSTYNVDGRSGNVTMNDKYPPNLPLDSDPGVDFSDRDSDYGDDGGGETSSISFSPGTKYLEGYTDSGHQYGPDDINWNSQANRPYNAEDRKGGKRRHKSRKHTSKRKRRRGKAKSRKHTSKRKRRRGKAKSRRRKRGKAKSRKRRR
jgi:hypothetical protein